MKKQKKANFDADYSLNLKVPTTQNKYGVKIDFYDKQGVLEKLLHYEVLLDISMQEPNLWAFRFNKKNIRFNYKQPELIAEKLTTHLMNALYPFTMIVNEQMQPIKNITNIGEIQNRWKSEKRAINRKYNSKVTDKFINKVDKSLNNLHLQNFLQKDWFFTLFFHPIFLRYTATLKQESIIGLPLIPYKSPVLFRGTLEPKEFLTPYNTLQVLYQGNAIIKNNIPLIIETNETELKAESTILYDIDNQTRLPFLIKMKCNIIDNKGNLMKRVQLSAFTLNTQEKTSTSKRQMQFFINEKPLQKTAMPTQKDKDSKNPSLWKQIKNYRYKK